MSKLTVLRPIEREQIVYVPQGATEAVKGRSAGNGAEIPVDASGAIELDAAISGGLHRRTDRALRGG